MNKATNNGPNTDGVRLLVPSLPVGDATLDQLQGWLESVIRAENQLAGFRTGVLAELTRREGIHLTENNLRETGLRPRRKARSEVETALELEELPETSKGLRDGKIPYENARILAKASQRGEIDETDLGDQARSQAPDKFAGTVRKYEQERSQDDGMSRLEHQRSRRFAKIKTSVDDGMTVLYGRFDPVTGALLETALSQKMDQLWREEDPRDRATPGQRMADALVQLVTREDTDEDGGRVRGPRLLLIADYDVISRELRNGRLGDGTPIPVEKVRDLACRSDILPAIFRGVSQPLDLGRARRIASPAQRVALVVGTRRVWDAAPPPTGVRRITSSPGRCKVILTCMCLLCSRSPPGPRRPMACTHIGIRQVPPQTTTKTRPANIHPRNPNYRHRRSAVKQRK